MQVLEKVTAYFVALEYGAYTVNHGDCFHLKIDLYILSMRILGHLKYSDKDLNAMIEGVIKSMKDNDDSTLKMMLVTLFILFLNVWME